MTQVISTTASLYTVAKQTTGKAYNMIDWTIFPGDKVRISLSGLVHFTNADAKSSAITSSVYYDDPNYNGSHTQTGQLACQFTASKVLNSSQNELYPFFVQSDWLSNPERVSSLQVYSTQDGIPSNNVQSGIAVTIECNSGSNYIFLAGKDLNENSSTIGSTGYGLCYQTVINFDVFCGKNVTGSFTCWQNPSFSDPKIYDVKLDGIYGWLDGVIKLACTGSYGQWAAPVIVNQKFSMGNITGSHFVKIVTTDYAIAYQPSLTFYGI